MLAAELRARRVPLHERRWILLELHDHIECEPGCEDRLGDPRQLAASFADELATARARGGAFVTFGALTLAAVALTVSQVAISAAGGYPGYANAISLVLFFPALAGMFFGPQVALVAGSLAALRAVRRRRAARLPSAEISLICRRARIALLAGFATVGGLALYVAAFAQRLPAWYVGVVGGLTGFAGVALYCAWRTLARAQAIVSDNPGGAGDVYDDVPMIGWRWLRHRPWRLGAGGALMVCVVTTIFFAHAERSLQEGLERGLVEGLAAGVAFALLGRAIGLTSGAGELQHTRAKLIDGEGDELPSDAHRSHAELVLREAFGDERLTVDELGTRLSAVHEAKTLADLREALRGLPGVK
jgi:hypothetical protein